MDPQKIGDDQMSKKKSFFRFGLFLVFAALAIMLLVLLFGMGSEEASAENETINCCFKGHYGYNYGTGYAEGIAVAGDYTYVVDGGNGLIIVDTSDKSDPLEAGHYSTIDYAGGIAVADDYAYVAESNGLVIVDIANKTDPKEAGHYNTAGSAVGVAVAGDYAYVADSWEGLVIIDIRN